MKLLITLDFPPEIGGIQNYLFQIVKNTYAKDDLILTCGKRGDVDRTIKAKILRVFKLPNKKWSLIIMAPILLKKILKNRLNIIESGNIYAAILPWFLSFFIKINYSIYTYGTELLPLKNKKLKTLLLKSVLNRANKLNTLLESQKLSLQSVTTNKNIEIITPKISLKRKWINKKTDIHKPLNILTVGRLVKHKGHDILIKAVSKLNIDLNLTIIGNGPEKNNLINLIDTLSLHKKVSILCNITDKQLDNFYKNSDIFILPSLKIKSGCEGFGIVLLEAMSYSLPIIASNSGGISEVIGYGKFGTLFESGNIDELCTAITEFIEKSDTYKKITKLAFNHLVDNYVWK